MSPFTRLLWSSLADHTALSSFTSEASLLAGTNEYPSFPALWFDGPNAVGKTFRFVASGILGSTATPTYLFTVRIGTTVAAITDSKLVESAALTTASGISNKRWELVVTATLRTPGMGAGNSTFNTSASVCSPGGLAAPYEYTLTPGGGESATWTVAPANFDSKAINYLALSVTCSASDAGNTIRCKEAYLFDLG